MMKHFYEKQLLAGLCLIGALFLLMLCAAPNGAAAQDNGTAGGAGLLDEPAADPFSYNLPSDSRGFLPSLTGSVPAGIRVVGILCLSGKKPLAALQFPGYDEPFYVNENDLIAVREADIPSAGSTQGGAKNNTNEIMYVQVGTIGRGQVELFPKANPSNIQILR
jgi:hypothetical protein